VPMRALSLDDLQRIYPGFTADALTVWDFERSVEQRKAPGGTARESVLAQIAQARAILGVLE